jgi:hypothetical protein
MISSILNQPLLRGFFNVRDLRILLLNNQYSF